MLIIFEKLDLILKVEGFFDQVLESIGFGFVGNDELFFSILVKKRD